MTGPSVAEEIAALDRAYKAMPTETPIDQDPLGRFRLESEISDAWVVLDNLKRFLYLLQAAADDGEGQVSGEWINANIAAILVNHEMVMEKLSRTFEDMISLGMIHESSLENLKL